MWDEKKFFDDFVKESEKIVPDDSFVDNLKSMAAQGQRKKPIPMIKYAAIAASFILCIGLGGLVWHDQSSGNGDDPLKQEAELQAGQEQSGIHIPAQTAEGMEIEVEDAVEYMRQGVPVVDQNGDQVSQEQQEDLLNVLKNAVKTEEDPEKEAVEEYNLQGDTTIQIKVYEDNYISINGTMFKIK